MKVMSGLRASGSRTQGIKIVRPSYLAKVYSFRKLYTKIDTDSAKVEFTWRCCARDDFKASVCSISTNDDSKNERTDHVSRLQGMTALFRWWCEYGSWRTWSTSTLCHVQCIQVNLSILHNFTVKCRLHSTMANGHLWTLHARYARCRFNQQCV